MTEPWTPGPWKFARDFKHRMTVESADGEFSLTGSPLDEEVEPRLEANFRLIALAPEMAEALERVAIELDNYYETEDIEWGGKPHPRLLIHETHSLLAKARGET